MTLRIHVSQHQPISDQVGNSFPVRRPSCLRRVANIINIVATETWATLRYVLPASIAWVWRKYISRDIRTISLQVTVGEITKFAYLNIHGAYANLIADKIVSPVLFSHGDYGHPFTMLHLADIAQRIGTVTFSLYIPGVQNNEQFAMHNTLLRKAIDKIEEIVRHENGTLTGILGTGHSKAAILFAQRQFVDLDPRIKATCAIAGRLNVPDGEEGPDETLKNIVTNIYRGIRNSQLPLVQIVPEDDWNASQDSMAVRPDNNCYFVPGMHLSGLYKDETRNHFTHFLHRFST